MLSKDVKKKILNAQRNEITEHLVYSKLSKLVKSPHNKKILQHLSKDELRHYHLWKKLTGKDVKPKAFMLFTYVLISRILGLTFGIKLMEKVEGNAQRVYKNLAKSVPIAKTILKGETEHEKKLIRLLDEEHLS